MKLKRDHFGQIIEPPYILTKPSGERIGVIKCLTKDMTISFNAPHEIHFETALYIDGEKNPLYDHIVSGQFIEITEYGRFVIESCETSSEGTMRETKTCSAISKEVLLGQKYLELFTINMGTTESIDNVQFYNLQNPDRSLLHLVLAKCPDWEIGHVDSSLMTLHRCFEETRTDIYSFLTTSMAAAFQCVFLFDSYNNRINIYSEDTAGTDTDIYVTYQNLLKSTSISSSLDDIKTCLTVTGANDLNLREVNMGYDKIYMLDYFATTEYMSYGLYNAYNAWKTKWNSHLPAYTSLLSQYQKYYEDIAYETSVKMPVNSASTVWSEYGLKPLQEKLKAYEGNLAVMIKAGQGDPSHRDYNTLYLPCFNTIQAIKEQISAAQNTIDRLKKEQAVVGGQMNSLMSDLDMTNNFTKAQLKELSLFIREEKLSSDNYVVTDSMTDSERMDMLGEMLEFGRKELRRISQPQYQFSANLLNLHTIPEFDREAELFNVGNYIHIILRDDYMVKAKILQIKVNFLDGNDFDVTFGTLSKLNGSNLFTDVTQAVNTAVSVSTTVSFNASHWNKANKEVTDINEMLSSGLLAAGESLKTARSDVEIDDRGILISNTPESTYKDDKIFIGDGKIMFSDDGLKTVKTAIGHLTYTKKGATYTDFGVLAQFLIAGYIASSTIEGNEIIGGTITGSRFNNGNGTFSVDENGILTATKGRIGCDKSGKGGFTIEANKIYSGKDSLSSGKDGVYLGTDGIALGANSVFKVTSGGVITATSGHIGGANIVGNAIRSDNGNWSINSDGTATFKNTAISGASSSFNIGGGFGLTGLALNNFNDLVANKITANYIDVTVGLSANYATVQRLDAVSGRVGTLEADHVSANSFDALSATVNEISTTYITAQTVKAEYMEVANWTSAGYIKAERIDTDTIISKIASAQNVSTKGLSAMSFSLSGAFNYQGHTWITKTTTFKDGTTITYLGSSTD